MSRVPRRGQQQLQKNEEVFADSTDALKQKDNKSPQPHDENKRNQDILQNDADKKDTKEESVKKQQQSPTPTPRTPSSEYENNNNNMSKNQNPRQQNQTSGDKDKFDQEQQRYLDEVGADGPQENDDEEYENSDHQQYGDDLMYGGDADDNNDNDENDDNQENDNDYPDNDNDDHNDITEEEEEAVDARHQHQEDVFVDDHNDEEHAGDPEDLPVDHEEQQNQQAEHEPTFQQVGAAERFGLEEERAKLSPALLRVHRKSLAIAENDGEHGNNNNDDENAVELFFDEDDNREEKNMTTNYDRKFEASAKRTRPFRAKTEPLNAPKITVTYNTPTTTTTTTSTAPAAAGKNKNQIKSPSKKNREMDQQNDEKTPSKQKQQVEDETAKTDEKKQEANNVPSSPGAAALAPSPSRTPGKSASSPNNKNTNGDAGSASRRRSSASNKNNNNAPLTVAMRMTLQRTPPHRTSWFQWRPTDADQLENAERVLLAPVAGRYVQNKISTLNTLSFLPPKEIIERLKELEVLTTAPTESNRNTSPTKNNSSGGANAASVKPAKKSANVVLRHLIFVHGLAGGAATWLPQLKYFADLFDKKNYVAAFGDQVLAQYEQEEWIKSEKEASVRRIEEEKILRESQRRLPLAESFFASSFVSPTNKRFHQSQNQQERSIMSINPNESVNAASQNSMNNKSKRNFAAYAAPAPTQEEMEKSARAQNRKSSKHDKITLHIVHSIDLPGFGRSDRDATVEAFDGAPEANEYMIKRLSDWTVAMDFENVDKWLLQMQLPGVVVTSSPSPPSSSSPTKKESNTSISNNNNNEASSSNSQPLEIISPTATSSSSPNKNTQRGRNASNPRTRSVIIILHDEDEKEKSVADDNNNDRNEKDQAAASPSKPQHHHHHRHHDHQKQKHDDRSEPFDQQQTASASQRNNANRSNNGVPPRRIAEDYSFRRKGAEIDEHIKNFEESQNNNNNKSRGNSLCVSESTRTGKTGGDLGSQESSHMEDVPEHDTDNDSDNDYYKHPSEKASYDPHPNNSNKKSSSHTANDYHEPVSTSLPEMSKSRRDEVRASQFIVPGEDSTFGTKRQSVAAASSSQNSKQVEMGSLFAVSLNTNDANNIINSNNNKNYQKSSDERAKVNFRGKFYTIKEIKEDKALQEDFTFGESKKFRSGRKSHITWCSHAFGAYLTALLACESPDVFDHVILADIWGMEPKPCEENDKDTFYGEMPCCWSCIGSCAHSSKALPFDAIRRAGMFGPSLLETVRPTFAARWRAIISDPAYFYDYLYHSIAQENPTGELALASASEKYAFAAIPLHEILVKKFPVRVDLSLIYGGNTFMESSIGFEATTTLRTQRREVYDRSKKMADEHEKQEQERYRLEKEKRDRLWKHAEDKYDREFMSESRSLRRDREEEIEEKQKEDYVMKLPRVGSISYEVVPKAGHQLFSDNVFAFNKLVQGSFEMV